MDKTIGIICQNKQIFKEQFSNFFDQFSDCKNQYVYQFINANDLSNSNFHYLLYLDSINDFGVSKLRQYLISNCSQTICIINDALGESMAFTDLNNIITYGENDCNYQVLNVFSNEHLLLFNLQFADHIYEFYSLTIDINYLHYLVSIIVLFMTLNVDIKLIRDIVEKEKA